MDKSYVIKSIMNRLFEQLVKSKASEYQADKTDEYFKENEGIRFCVKIDADNLGFENDGNTYHKEWKCRIIRYFHVIMLYPHRIFTCVTDEQHFSTIPQDDWKNTSNHNSCWRNGCDDLISVGYECWEEAFAKVPEEHRKPPMVEGLDYTLDLSIMGNIFEFISCDMESDYDNDSSGYHKKISNIKRIHKKLTI